MNPLAARRVLIIVFAFVAGVSMADDEAVSLNQQNTASESSHDAAVESAGPTFLRMSAIAGSDGDYFVGIVDNRNEDASLLRIGDVFAGYEVIDIRPESLAVLVRQDKQDYVLYLSGDETRMISLADVDEGEQWDAGIKPPDPFKTKESFLREAGEKHGFIEKDAPIPAELTDSVSAEEGLRLMAESVGLPVPDSVPKARTREDFFREHGVEP